MNKPTCVVCGYEDMKLVYSKAGDYITGDHFQVWQCQRCKAGITWPRPDNLSPYYPAKYRRYNPFIGNLLKFLYRQRVKKWSNQFPSPGMAFEMGCGDGLMLDTLRQLGWQVVGSERTPQAAYIPSQMLGLPVFVGGLETIHPSPQFELIFLFQVLEHLDDPVKVIGQLSNLLKPGGKLIIGVPNFAGWQASVGREKWFHLDVPRHLVHYSPSALQTVLEPFGLKIEKISYSSWEHDPYGWVQSILNRLDWRHNRLTRLLMQIDRPGPMNLLHLAVSGGLGLIAMILSPFSWLLQRGGLIEITASGARKRSENDVTGAVTT
jgi:SAM-dependent methyltransferase